MQRLLKYPKPASQNSIDEISRQMKHSFYKVYEQDCKSEIGTGFFCYIKYTKTENRNVPVIIINNIVSNKDNIETIKVSNNNFKTEIKLGETRFKSKDFNMTILEIK